MRLFSDTSASLVAKSRFARRVQSRRVIVDDSLVRIDLLDAQLIELPAGLDDGDDLAESSLAPRRIGLGIELLYIREMSIVQLAGITTKTPLLALTDAEAAELPNALRIRLRRTSGAPLPPAHGYNSNSYGENNLTGRAWIEATAVLWQGLEDAEPGEIIRLEVSWPVIDLAPVSIDLALPGPGDSPIQQAPKPVDFGWSAPAERRLAGGLAESGLKL